MTNPIEKFKKFDAYAKTLEDFRVKTIPGATITVIGVITMLLLFWSEFNAYMSPKISEELFVDTSRGPKLDIHFSIIFPRISCSYLTLDAMDTSGEQHNHVEHNIYKLRLNLEGEPIKEPEKEDIMISKKLPSKNETQVAVVACGSCYGAAQNESQCCNTCEDVKRAYQLKRWAMPDLSTVEQCKNDNSNEKVSNAFKEGCHLYGHMEVNRVGGIFHIAPGQSFSINHVHVHDVQPFSSGLFNTTHYIKQLSFGTEIQHSNPNPLNENKVIATEGATMFQYYIKIVPTLYVKLDGSAIYTNQFSVTRHQKSINKMGESGMPGVFFNYELSPLMVKYSEKKRSLGHFATSVCVIVAGVFTIAGILDALLYHSLNAIQKKIELGKAS